MVASLLLLCFARLLLAVGRLSRSDWSDGNLWDCTIITFAFSLLLFFCKASGAVIGRRREMREDRQGVVGRRYIFGIFLVAAWMNGRLMGDGR